MAVRFGIIVPQGWRLDLREIADPQAKYAAMTRVALEAERLGYDSIWLYDHFHTVPTPELETTFECWTSTAALARDTQTIRIGQMVTCNNYRPPALLAKMASTVDVLSGGRLDFGIGAGWYEEEFTAYGYPYADGPERLRMLDEALQVIRAMWTEPYATVQGRYYQVQGAINEPKGVQKPHPPIWVGGSGEQVTLKLVAQYGDACNITANEPETCRHKFEVLRRHCERLGRDYDTIIKSVHSFIYLLEPNETATTAIDHARQTFGIEYTEQTLRERNLVGTTQEIIDGLGTMIAAGTEYVIIYFRRGLTNLEAVQRFAEDVMPAFK